MAAIIRSLLPKRSAEDIVAGNVRLLLGVGKDQREVILPVLPISGNRIWKEHFNRVILGVLPSLSSDLSGGAMLNLLTGMTDQQLELLVAYDTSGRLPDQQWIEDHVSEPQLLTLLLGVTAAAFPLAATAIELVRESSDLQTMVRLAFLRSMSSVPPNTDGPQEPSSAS